MALNRSRMGLILVTVAAAGLGGCVAQSRMDELSDTQRSLQEQATRATLEAQQARTEAETERSLRQRAETAAAEQAQRNRDLQARLDAAMSSYDGLQQRLGDLALLDPETDRALAALAAANPDLVRYDPAKGMLRFASDLTFDSGQDVVKDAAKQSLAALARVLTQSSAANYEIRIEGHTDSQKISAGTASRHPTNRHLSCHRAIAVAGELVRLGVPAGRVLAAGWGEERPAVPNTANGNTPANRRVEIYLVASRAGSASTGNATPDTDGAPARQPDVNK